LAFILRVRYNLAVAKDITLLSIETSCDETAVSVIGGTGTYPDVSLKTRGEALLSQAKLHAKYGGVFPALAKREHAGAIVPLIEDALSKAGLLITGHTDISVYREQFAALFAHEPGLAEQLLAFLARTEKPRIDAVAVTAGPGLEPALWVGINTAKALAAAWDVPIIPTNHMEGHFVAPLAAHGSLPELSFPILGLMISGGHTEFVLMKEWLSYEVLGQTLDDAVGEAFDKTARLLGLPYPGGPEISKLAETARTENLESPWKLPRPMIQSTDLRFSFSGLKTAVLYTVKTIEQMTDETKKLLALEFENAVTEVITSKTRRALEQTGARTFLIGGGVAANTHIRRELKKMIEDDFSDVALYLPEPKITGDNATMIGQAAMLHLLSGKKLHGGDIRANGNLSF
jgi:N6-L-threonylcarbamoyladenine synthase